MLFQSAVLTKLREKHLQERVFLIKMTQTMERSPDQCALAQRATEARRQSQLQTLRERRHQLPLGKIHVVLILFQMLNSP